MSVLIVPPLADPTLEIRASQDVVDLNAGFFSRHADADHAATLADRFDRPDTPDPLTALSLAAAATILAVPRPDRAHLRALGTVLRAVSADDDGLDLAVDDVHLRRGSTQSSPAVARAVDRTSLFAPEQEAARRLASADSVALLIDTDIQLPGALAIARSLRGACLRLCGRFAAAHDEALRAALRRHADVSFADDLARSSGDSASAALTLTRHLRAAWSGAFQGLRWVAADDRPPTTGAWAGWLDAERVDRLSDADTRRCAGVVVAVASHVGGGTFVGPSGGRVDLTSALAALPASSQAFAELLVGTPATSRDAVARTAARLVDGAPVQLAGLRPYRLPTGVDEWGGAPVTLEPPDPAHDLPRWRTGTAPGMLTVEDRDAAVQALLADTTERADLFPGRVAGAVTGDVGLVPLEGVGGWDRSSALVTTRRCAPDEGPPGDFLVSLRTGSVARLSPGLAGVVCRLAAGDAEVRHAVPGTAWERLTRRLAAAGHIRELP